MKNKPSITLFVYAYNHEKYIRKAILSAFNQVCPPDEIILSDDCSTDGTWDIMQEEAKKYVGSSKLILNRNIHNLGITDHLNKIMEMGTGDWFVLAAGDDISLPNRCTILVDAIKKYPNAKFIATGYNIIDESGTFNYYKGFDEIHPYPTGATGAWCRNCFDFFGPITEPTTAEDIVIPFRAALLGEILLINTPTIDYREHSASVSSPTNQNLVQSWEHLLKIKIQLVNACYQRLMDLEKYKDNILPQVYTELKQKHNNLISQFKIDYINIFKWCEVVNLSLFRKLVYLFSKGEYKHKLFYYRLKIFLISLQIFNNLFLREKLKNIQYFISNEIVIIEIQDFVNPNIGVLIYL